MLPLEYLRHFFSIKKTFTLFCVYFYVNLFNTLHVIILFYCLFKQWNEEIVDLYFSCRIFTIKNGRKRNYIPVVDLR